ncbi:MAG: ABC transporter ATP-binding protein [Firmicutes bacterium]|nr:ABC transporter ATP-binding protein [Bacillota bacterium]
MGLAIECRGVEKSLSGRKAVDHLDWSAECHRFHGLVGANGAGKTTLLRLILGVLKADRGTLAVLGQTAGPANADLRQHVIYVASHQRFPQGWTVEEWLRYLSLIYKRWNARMATRLLDAMAILPKTSIGALSTGAQASLRMASAVASRPALLLLDEATNGMDAVVKQQMLRLLLDFFAAEEATVVMATHALDELEQVAETVSILHGGRLVMQQDLERLKKEVHRLQVVVGSGWAPDSLRHPEVLDVQWRGQVAMVTVTGSLDAWGTRLKQAGAVLVEPVDTPFGEIFRSVMKREGYARDDVVWDA